MAELLGGLIVVAVVAVLGVSSYTIGYREGQHDALSGTWRSARVVAPDGTVSYIELDKPTTQPVTMEAK